MAVKMVGGDWVPGNGIPESSLRFEGIEVDGVWRGAKKFLILSFNPRQRHSRAGSAEKVES